VHRSRPADRDRRTRRASSTSRSRATLTKFWGRKIELGATVLLPKGFDEHPDSATRRLRADHFRAPGGYGRGGKFDAFGRGRLAALPPRPLQHPTPFYDDSYAVNSANNGPYGDAIVRSSSSGGSASARSASRGRARSRAARPGRRPSRSGLPPRLLQRLLVALPDSLDFRTPDRQHLQG
jgi:hypothetical protein